MAADAAVDGCAVKMSCVAGPALLVRLKLAGVALPAVAVTVYAPDFVLAVKLLEVAWPSPPVLAVVLLAALAKLPDAPVVGAVKVTVVPGTGLPYWSVTLAVRAVVKAVFIAAAWPEPDTAATLAGAPAVFVAEKLVAPVTPAALAAIA